MASCEAVLGNWFPSCRSPYLHVHCSAVTDCTPLSPQVLRHWPAFGVPLSAQAAAQAIRARQKRAPTRVIAVYLGSMYLFLSRTFAEASVFRWEIGSSNDAAKGHSGTYTPCTHRFCEKTEPMIRNEFEEHHVAGHMSLELGRLDVQDDRQEHCEGSAQRWDRRVLDRHCLLDNHWFPFSLD